MAVTSSKVAPGSDTAISAATNAGSDVAAAWRRVPHGKSTETLDATLPSSPGRSCHEPSTNSRFASRLAARRIAAREASTSEAWFGSTPMKSVAGLRCARVVR